MSREILKWVDIETTGLNYKSDQIMEVGIIITNMSLEPIFEHSLPIWGDLQEDAWSKAVPFVKDMHTGNGLLDDCLSMGAEIEEFASELGALLDPEWVDNTDPMCGSSVGFDRIFLTREIPKTIRALFSYRNIDVSSFKETVERFRPALAEARDATVVPRKKHRVIPDLLDTIDEYRFYLKHMGLMGGRR